MMKCLLSRLIITIAVIVVVGGALALAFAILMLLVGGNVAGFLIMVGVITSAILFFRALDWAFEQEKEGDC